MYPDDEDLELKAKRSFFILFKLEAILDKISLKIGLFLLSFLSKATFSRLSNLINCAFKIDFKFSLERSSASIFEIFDSKEAISSFL